MSDDTERRDRLEQSFMLRSLAAGADPARTFVAFADLVRYLDDPASLTVEKINELRTNAGLQATLKRLRQDKDRAQAGATDRLAPSSPTASFEALLRRSDDIGRGQPPLAYQVSLLSYAAHGSQKAHLAEAVTELRHLESRLKISAGPKTEMMQARPWVSGRRASIGIGMATGTVLLVTGGYLFYAKNMGEFIAERAISIFIKNRAEPHNLVEPPRFMQMAKLSTRMDELFSDSEFGKINPAQNAFAVFGSARQALGASTDFTNMKGRMPRPIQGRIAVMFGEAAQDGSKSNGIAIEASSNDSIISPGDGWVAYIGAFSDYGQIAVIDGGGGYHILLAGLETVDVTPGQFLRMGERIGRSQSSNKNVGTSSIVYVEFRKDQRPFDPEPWFENRAAAIAAVRQDPAKAKARVAAHPDGRTGSLSSPTTAGLWASVVPAAKPPAEQITAGIFGKGSTPTEPPGHFMGEAVLTMLPDGRNMKLVKPFGYVDSNNQAWSVPAGIVTNGTSIPRVLSITHSPFTGKYRLAAVIHDYYCQQQTRPWRETHRVFYDAMLTAGVPVQTAKVMFGAVYSFGPRWGKGTELRGPVASNYASMDKQTDFMRHLDAWIGRDNPSPEAIEQVLDAGHLPK